MNLKLTCRISISDLIKVDSIEKSILNKYVEKSLKLSMIWIEESQKETFIKDFEKGIAFMKKIDNADIDTNIQPLYNVLDYYRPDLYKMNEDEGMKAHKRDFILS